MLISLASKFQPAKDSRSTLSDKRDEILHSH